MFLSNISIKRPIAMSMFLIVFLIFGGLAYFTLSLDLMPNVKVPFVTIQTIYPGAGPKEIETQVSKKIEDAAAMVSQIEFVRSFSMEGVSVIQIKFDLDKDIDIAVQETKDKVDAILNDLPKDCKKPLIQKYDIAAQPIVDIVVSGDMGLSELYEIADKKIKDSFAQIDGVSKVDIIGGQKREIKIELDNKVVFENKISMTQLNQIIAAGNMDMPGGNFQRMSQEYSARLKGQFNSVQEIQDYEIPTATGKKKLGNIADVRDAGKDIREKTIYFDNEKKLRNENVVLLSVVKSADGNAVELAKVLKEKLPEIKASLPQGINMTIVSDKSNFTEASVEDTLSNVIMGILLTGLVLLFFLHDLRSTIIVALAMPMSIISTFMLMQWSGFTLNIMSLMGLSTSVGILVANSVVVLENIFRYKEMGISRREAAQKGTSEVVIAVMASTLTNIVVFLPIGSMTSMVGQFFKEFALTVTYATIFSLIISFTLTPMLASMILPEHDTKKHPLGKWLEGIFHSWERFYGKTLEFVLHNKKRIFATFGLTLIALVVSFMMAAKIGFEFVPLTDEGEIQVKVELPQGYNIKETTRFLKKIEDRINQHDYIKHTVTKIGKLSEIEIGTNLAVINVQMIDFDKRELSSSQAANILMKELSDIPNAKIHIAAVSSGGGSGEAPIQFFLKGNDLDKLESIKNDILRKIKNVPGLDNLTTSSRSGKPEITLIPDRQKLLDAGLTVYDVAMTLRSAMEGFEVSRYRENGEEYDIRVSIGDYATDTPEKIGNLPVISPVGVFRMSQLAKIEFTEGYSKILHDDKAKAIQFTANNSPDVPLGDVVNSIREKLDKIQMPASYRVEWGGDVKMMEEAVADMGRTFLIAVILTYMLLAAMLESFKQPLMILATIPMGLVGVFGSLYFTGKTMNIMSMMAIIMLVGIVVNNAILILEYANQLIKEGKKVKEALLIAAPTKLKPILMSTIAIILGMVPMALGMGSAGREFRQPMGIVSIGGLVVSTILTLYLIPAIFQLTTRDKKH